MRAFIWEKNASGSKAASFPALGLGKTIPHVTRGEDIRDSANALQCQVATNDILVRIDRPMVSSTSIDISDDLMSDDVTVGRIAAQLGEALARDIDRKILRAGVLGARATTNITDVSGYDNVPGGTQLKKGATIGTTESVIRLAIIEAAQTLEEHDSGAEAFAILTPTLYHLLLQNGTIMGAEYGKQAGVDGRALNIHGVTVMSSNNIPTDNTASTHAVFGNLATAGNQNTYYGDFSNTVGLVVAGREAIGGAIIREVKAEVEMGDWAREAHFLKVSFVGGFSVLRPEALIELSSAT